MRMLTCEWSGVSSPVGLCHVVRAYALEQNATAKEKILVSHTVF